ncbi:hypothetical protein F4814DRAFT_329968 [Daldinia grandis]|nr:hypothetical protein F4814DRAFT_329968 [Daldinia grandis]
MSFPPSPTLPLSPQNALNGLSMEERWAWHLRNRQNMTEGVIVSATVEQQNWYYGQLRGQSTTTQYEPSEYHGPRASPYQSSKQQTRFGFVGSPSLNRSDLLSSVEKTVFADGAPSYTFRAEDNRHITNPARGTSDARGQSRNSSFYGLMKTVIRKAYALFITTIDAATQTTPFSNNTHGDAHITSSPNVSVNGIQAKINGRTNGTVSTVGEGMGKIAGISTRPPSGHIRWSDIEATRSMTGNLTAVHPGSNNNVKRSIYVACPALSVPHHLITVNDHLSTSNVVVMEVPSPPGSVNGVESTSPTRTPLHTRASSPTGESSTGPTLGAYVSSPKPVMSNEQQPPNGPSLGSAETLVTETSVDESSADCGGEAHTSGPHEGEPPTGTNASTLEQQSQSEGVTDGLSDNRVLPAGWIPAFHERGSFEQQLDLAMVPGLQPRPGPELPPAYQPEDP